MTTAIDMARIGAEARILADDFRRRWVEADDGFVTFMATEGLMVEMCGRKDFAYGSYQHLVFDYGEWHRSLTLKMPDHYKKGQLRECFKNALTLAMEDDDLIYFEGYACTSNVMLPVLHAWCVSRSTGLVIDPTWANFADEDPDVNGYYLGIPFDTEFVLRRTLQTEHWGLLGNDWQPGDEGIGTLALTLGFVTDHEGIVYDYNYGEAA